ncbi:hypothetical protein PR202_ga27623 [Eleusine coracana subsp. coracana]|uniref:BTB domain-containing protein n=1 Tax=Eleusine coracana subsp. coracana TaxID=191504 RepID=A0AAV5DGF7_ELECO|nr:hypothetical protein QOZ80_8AG0622320 [Eleusine coracana subsp. coracana]GJN09602.1 hypothetical protein PR202_ga27623 [Eleusine coracana subsp. coracana]
MGSKHRNTGSYEFVVVVDYSRRQKGLGVGCFIRSGTFSVGGLDWAIRFYPDGQRRLFRSCDDESRLGPRTPAFISRTNLEKDYVVGDRLTIKCNLRVITINHRHQVRRTKPGTEITVPPSDLSKNFGTLLLEQDASDVTFRVGGEDFPHKLVLAARSAVFKAELYGQMKETTARYVTIEDVQPAVFKALLHFIYTDSLPPALDDDLERDDYCEMIRHLLVAANRYAMDRLKLLSANILVEHLDVEELATTLALADQHNCDILRDVCIEILVSEDGMMDAVMATPGYANLKTSSPTILTDLLEKISKYGKAHRQIS